MNSEPYSGIKRITVFGGSGATGRTLIRHALVKGLRVRTLVRDPASLGDSLEGAEIVKGSLLNADDVDMSLKGTEAVFCVFGPRPPYTDVFCEEATKTIIASMKKYGVDRLICQTGGMIGDYPENRTLFFRMMVSLFNKRVPLIALDRTGQEKQVINSGLSWTIVKPPRLVNNKPTGEVVAGHDVKLGLLSSITRDDLAEFLIHAAMAKSHDRSIIFARN